MRASPLSRATPAGRPRLDLDAVDEPVDRRQGHAALAERRAARARCSAGRAGWARSRAPPGARGGTGAYREGMPPGAAPPPSCRCPGRPGRPARRGGRSPDDLVLLALDGGDDVAHGPGAGPLERGQQGAGAAESAARRVSSPPPSSSPRSSQSRAPVDPAAPVEPVDRRRGEALVLDADDPPALGGEMAPQDQAHGVAARGPVEGLGHRGPPVHHQGLEVLARDPQPADVEALGPLRAVAPARPPVAVPARARRSGRSTAPAPRCRAGRGGPGWCGR